MSQSSRERILSRAFSEDFMVVSMPVVDICGSWESAGLFHYLYSLFRKNSYIEFSISEEKLCQKMRIGRWALRNAKKILLDKGLISCSLKGNPARHYYTINEEQFTDLLVLSQSQTSANKLCGNQTTSCVETKQLYKTISSDQNHEISSDITKVISSEINAVVVKNNDFDFPKQKGKALSLEESNFETFWQSWPGERKGKQKAKEAWLKAKVPIGIALKALQMLQETRSMLVAANITPEYLPHPTTWINQKRWEDEISIESTNKLIRERSKIPFGERRDMPSAKEVQKLVSKHEFKLKDGSPI